MPYKTTSLFQKEDKASVNDFHKSFANHNNKRGPDWREITTD